MDPVFKEHPLGGKRVRCGDKTNSVSSLVAQLSHLLLAGDAQEVNPESLQMNYQAYRYFVGRIPGEWIICVWPCGMLGSMCLRHDLCCLSVLVCVGWMLCFQFGCCVRTRYGKLQRRYACADEEQGCVHLHHLIPYIA